MYNPNIKNEKFKNCLHTLQKRLQNIWIRKIVTDYIKNNHNQINTTELRILLYKADLDIYFDKQKINEAFDQINIKIEKENLDEGFILLEPAFYLHSESSLTYNNDKTIKKTINDNLFKFKYNNTIDTNSKFTDDQKARNWRIIVRVDYETETIKLYISYERINNKDAIYNHTKCTINNHLQYIINNMVKLSNGKIVCNLKKTYTSFGFLKLQTYDTLHVADVQQKTKKETNSTQN